MSGGAGLDSDYDGVESHVRHVKGLIQLLGEKAGDLDIDTGEGVAGSVLERRELGIGRDHEVLVMVGGNAAGGVGIGELAGAVEEAVDYVVESAVGSDLVEELVGGREKLGLVLVDAESITFAGQLKFRGVKDLDVGKTLSARGKGEGAYREERDRKDRSN